MRPVKRNREGYLNISPPNSFFPHQHFILITLDGLLFVCICLHSLHLSHVTYVFSCRSQCVKRAYLCLCYKMRVNLVFFPVVGSVCDMPFWTVLALVKFARTELSLRFWTRFSWGDKLFLGIVWKTYWPSIGGFDPLFRVYMFLSSTLTISAV